MERLKTLFILCCTSIGALGQSVDFGLEVSQNYNSVKKFQIQDIYSPENLAVSVLDLAGDTSNIYFYKFTMDNHVELPLYFRLNLRKRWFFDFKMSNSVNRMQMWGVSNYSDQYFIDNYGTYDQFISAASLDGFTNADSTDYIDYMKNARELNEADVRTTEEFKLLSFTANAGIRFFPHKSVKMFVAAGFTIKSKYRKHLYNNLNLSNDNLQNLSSIDNALDKYSEKSTYFNFQMGLELYRFRISAFSQLGVSYTFDPQPLGPEIVYASDFTAFDIVRSYGFSMSANLFSVDIGKRVKIDDVSQDDIIVSNIQPKKEKWDIGIRYDRRGFNDLTSYFENPEGRLSVLRTDSILYNNWGTFVEGQNIQMLTLGEVKRVEWGGRLNGVMNIYLTKRLGIRGSLGGSKLTFDIETKELDATIIGNDSIGYSYLIAPGTPKLKSAVYRKSINIVDLNFGITYKVVNRDLFSLALSTGFGFSGMGYVTLSKNGSPEGVNELEVYQDLDDYYTGFDETNLKLYNGALPVDLNASPTDLLSKFDEPYNGFGGNEGSTIRLVYPTVNFGLEANIERYTVGFGFEMSAKHMDNFLLYSSKSAYMSVGYKLFRR